MEVLDVTNDGQQPPIDDIDEVAAREIGMAFLTAQRAASAIVAKARSEAEEIRQAKGDFDSPADVDLTGAGPALAAEASPTAGRSLVADDERDSLLREVGRIEALFATSQQRMLDLLEGLAGPDSGASSEREAAKSAEPTPAAVLPLETDDRQESVADTTSSDEGSSAQDVGEDPWGRFAPANRADEPTPPKVEVDHPEPTGTAAPSAEKPLAFSPTPLPALVAETPESRIADRSADEAPATIGSPTVAPEDRAPAYSLSPPTVVEEQAPALPLDPTPIETPSSSPAQLTIDGGIVEAPMYVPDVDGSGLGPSTENPLGDESQPAATAPARAGIRAVLAKPWAANLLAAGIAVIVLLVALALLNSV
jgi:hypothetical protein